MHAGIVSEQPSHADDERYDGQQADGVRITLEHDRHPYLVWTSVSGAVGDDDELVRVGQCVDVMLLEHVVGQALVEHGVGVGLAPAP